MIQWLLKEKKRNEFFIIMFYHTYIYVCVFKRNVDPEVHLIVFECKPFIYNIWLLNECWILISRLQSDINGLLLRYTFSK